MATVGFFKIPCLIDFLFVPPTASSLEGIVGNFPAAVGMATAEVVEVPDVDLNIDHSPGVVAPGGETIANSDTPGVTISIRPVI